MTAVQPILTYNARRGRLRVGRLDALDRLGPTYGLPPSGPVRCDVLEIGSGMGEAVVAMATADPGRRYLAVEVHTAGVANLLQTLAATGMTNVAVAQGDALALVRDRLEPGSVQAIHVFFPDPWPKARHAKRRLIQEAHVALLASRLAPGGLLHCATDAEEYAEQMLTVLSGSSLTNVHSGFAPRPPGRPVTRYERRALEAGRTVRDLVFRRAG